MIPSNETRKLVGGDDILYRFFLEKLLKDGDSAEHLSFLLVTTLAIWFPRETYQVWPVLLPHVIRDNQCRGMRRGDVVVRPEAWGEPNEFGYLRDDNSLIKSLPRSLVIRSPHFESLDGRRMGRSFVASHIWRTTGNGRSTNQSANLNSFIPNLVWLPRQIAKLSDIDDGLIMRTLKKISSSVYRDLKVTAPLCKVSSSCWEMLEYSGSLYAPDDLQLNWFETDANFVRTRVARVQGVIDLITSIDSNDDKRLRTRSLPERYMAGLPSISKPVRDELLNHLRLFCEEGANSLGYQY